MTVTTSQPLSLIYLYLIFLFVNYVLRHRRLLSNMTNIDDHMIISDFEDCALKLLVFTPSSI